MPYIEYVIELEIWRTILKYASEYGVECRNIPYADSPKVASPNLEIYDLSDYVSNYVISKTSTIDDVDLFFENMFHGTKIDAVGFFGITIEEGNIYMKLSFIGFTGDKAVVI